MSTRLLTALAAVLLLPAAASAATVTFGTPDLLVVPDGATSNWAVKVPDAAPGVGWTETASYHAINTKGNGAQNGRIVSTSVAHAINTKGTGTAGRLGFAGATSGGGAGGSVWLEAGRVAADGDGYAFTFVEHFVVPGAAPTPYQPIQVTLDGHPLNGSALLGLPALSITSDLTGINWDVNVTPPTAATPDTETFAWTVSAVTAVPEPTAVALAAVAGVACGCRRRRTR